jgi:transposase InsO family protein
VKNIYSKDSKMYKAYIVLYTCASSRAVHLDLAVDATSETFIRCFKRFMSRRVIPGTMISDNGKTFKSKELKEFCTSKRIKWVHIIARSPWWAGFYERLVRSVKRSYPKVVSFRT